MALEIRKDNNALDWIKDLPLRQCNDLLPLPLPSLYSIWAWVNTADNWQIYRHFRFFTSTSFYCTFLVDFYLCWVNEIDKVRQNQTICLVKLLLYKLDNVEIKVRLLYLCFYRQKSSPNMHELQYVRYIDQLRV